MSDLEGRVPGHERPSAGTLRPVKLDDSVTLVGRVNGVFAYIQFRPFEVHIFTSAHLHILVAIQVLPPHYSLSLYYTP